MTGSRRPPEAGTRTRIVVGVDACPASWIMDHLNLVDALYEQTGIDIPERDYPLITTIDGFVAYVVAAGPKEARRVC